MFGNFNPTVERALMADGYVPAGIDCLWIGDEFVWEGSYSHGSPLMYLRIVELKAHDASYTDEGGIRHQNTIVDIVAVDQDMVYKQITLSTRHHTWIRQCDRNKVELFDVKREYEETLRKFT